MNHHTCCSLGAELCRTEACLSISQLVLLVSEEALQTASHQHTTRTVHLLNTWSTRLIHTSCTLARCHCVVSPVFDCTSIHTHPLTRAHARASTNTFCSLSAGIHTLPFSHRSVYSAALVVVVAVPMYTAFSGATPDMLFAITTAGIGIGTLVVLAAMFLPKFWAVEVSVGRLP